MSAHPKVSICIATYNMAHLISKTISNCLLQDYPNLEVIVYDDLSTDDTYKVVKHWAAVKYICGKVNLGVGAAFSEAIKASTGDYIILMCADDIFTCREVISDMVKIFEEKKKVGYVTRFYYQFVDGYKGPVRAWRTKNPIVLANNPSGLGFRREAVIDKQPSNRMFIETSHLAAEVIKEGWEYAILPYDTIAVRVHRSTSTQKSYWLKRRVSSPVEDWAKIGGDEIMKDYVSFIQIKNGFTMKAVFEEIWNFIRLRPLNLLVPQFWFWAAVAVFTPRTILRKLPEFYRHRIGRLLTREVKRA